jgi:hypothetical protein
MNPSVHRPLRIAWAAALAMFAFAALTGALFRFAVAYAWGPLELGGLLLANIRHAHSHLMYFGWATPALMALIAFHVSQRGRQVPGIGGVLLAVFALATLAYPPFLLWGYGLVPIGAARLPLSMIAAGLNVLGWYAFVGVYLRATWGLQRDPALRGFDLALGLLVLSTFGAWALVAAGPLGLGSPAWTPALVHFFLDGFSEGWFVLGVLALGLAAATGARAWPLVVATIGVPFTFALALPASAVSPAVLLLGRVGGVLVAAGVLIAVVQLWPRLRGLLWRLALVCLALKAGGQIMVATIPSVEWTAMFGLRILYLHLMLLGFVSVGLVAAAHAVFGGHQKGEQRTWGWAPAAFAVSVGLVLGALLPLSELWPDALRGLWAYHLAAWTSLAPVAAALVLAVVTVRRRRTLVAT